jgi:hypothetical protein
MQSVGFGGDLWEEVYEETLIVGGGELEIEQGGGF